MRFMVACIVVFSLVSTSLAQTTWYVPDDFPAGIQAAISDPSVVSGDIIIVRPGTYAETITFEGKAVTLKSEKGPAVTIIDGGRYRSVVRFTKGEGPDAVLEGFTLTNGKGASGGLPHCRGGGISCLRSSSPTITGNIITDNTTPDYGGGIYCDESSPAITGNIISDNFGGVSGGGITCFDEADPVIVNNLIHGNSAYFNGGGIYCFLNSKPRIANNTIVFNSAPTGGGLYCYRHCWLYICNTILWGNDATIGPEIGLSSYSYASIFCSDVKGGKADVYNSGSNTLVWGAGMIDADPLFADPDNADFHLTYGSPCKNAGLNRAELPADDCEGDPRIFGGRADIGADEYCYHLYQLGSAVPGRWISVRVVGAPGAWVVLGEGAGVQDPPEPSSYGPVHIARPWTSQPLGVIPAEGILFALVQVPSSWNPGEERYFQAAVGGSITMLTNLMTVQVE